MVKDQYLILDAGNSIDRQSPYSPIAIKYIMQASALSGVEVMAIGPAELSLGDNELKKLQANSVVDMVSANLPGYLPFLRLNKNGCKVLVTSVIDPGIFKTLKIEYAGEIVDPVTALCQLQKKIKHDIFIVIVHAMGERISEIVNGCPGIDLAIDGLTHGVGNNLDKNANVPLVWNNLRGQYVNYLDYQPEPDRRLAAPVKKRAALGEIAEDPEIKKLVAAYDKEKQEYGAKLREERRRQRIMKITPNLYLGHRACESCHQESFKVWEESGHAHALAILERKGKERDDECLKCHVTGMMDRKIIGGFSSIDENPWMAEVQCEACHGPGANHVQQPDKSRMKMGSAINCQQCHTYTTDPDFDFKEKFELIKHSEKVK